MKPSVYLDTTIASYLFDDREALRYPSDITRKWWAEERGNYEVFLSVETIAELSAGDYPRKQEILALASSLQVLPPAPEIVEIAEEYIRHKLMPNEFRGDALHLAYASYYKMDFLPTWNCEHLANANKKKHIRVINSRLDLYTPEIITPLELFSER
jgi:predicted nucleic acid-binding protein